MEKQIEYLWPFCTRTNSPVGIIEIDIDFFKKYNDKFGHPEGDICLKKVAGVLQESARRSSDIAVRIGGEEFVVFVQNMSEKEIIKFALRIRDKIEELKIPHAWDEVAWGLLTYIRITQIISNSCTSMRTRLYIKPREMGEIVWCLVTWCMGRKRMKWKRFHVKLLNSERGQRLNGKSDREFFEVCKD